MPKIQKLRKHKIETKPYETRNEASSGSNNAGRKGKDSKPEEGKPMLSRGQKKRQMRKDRIINVKAMIESANKDSSNGRKPISFMFSDLEKSLPQNAEIVRPSAAAPRTNKMKGKVAVREVERMKLIQDHPSFKKDPLAAIKFHIEHMVAVQTNGQPR